MSKGGVVDLANAGFVTVAEGEEADLCPVCGGDGFIMAWEGDGSDWGEDTYSGPMDESIECRHCRGTGAI